ncbi:MAG: chromate transporter [Paludibacteraceae bacterium]|nr:chromate transporter [Paludibacteraceae bacterium]
MSLYLQLFITFFKIGLFGFGGGYSIAALIQDEVVNVNNWMSVAEFTDIMAISQATPGPIAINCATYVGYTATQSVLGSALATIAVTLPSVIIVGLVCVFYNKFKANKYVGYAFSWLKPLVVGLLASAAIMLCNKENFIDWYSIIIFAVVAALSIKRVNPIILLSCAGIVGGLIY